MQIRVCVKSDDLYLQFILHLKWILTSLLSLFNLLLILAELQRDDSQKVMRIVANVPWNNVETRCNLHQIDAQSVSFHAVKYGKLQDDLRHFIWWIY